MANTFEGRSRLVSLAYQVLNKIEVVVSGKTDGELMAVLAAAFHQHAAEVVDSELSRRKIPSYAQALQGALADPPRKVAA
jgi:hypothetical protein